METKIKYRWHTLENKRVKLMSDLSKYNNDVLNKKPTPEAWSTFQVMQHLMTAELRSLTYMKKKLSYGVNIPKAGFKSKLRRLALKIVFALPFKYKAPTQLETFPDSVNFESLKIEWASQRLDLQDFIDKLPDNVIVSEIWRHQIFGKMNIFQMIDFFETHFDRHEKQIHKTLNTITELL